jgi:hypothetical protein
MRVSPAVLVCALLMTGCGARDAARGPEQPNSEREAPSKQIAPPADEGPDPRALAEKNRETLREIEQQRAALARREQEVSQKEQAIAQEAERLKAEEQRLESLHTAVQAEELRNQKAKKDIAAKRAELRKIEGRMTEEKLAQGKQAETERQAKEEVQRRASDPVISRHDPYLEQLAQLTADLFPPGERDAMRKALAALYRQNKTAEIKDDQQFAAAAVQATKDFYLKKTKYPYTAREEQFFSEWREKYLEAAAVIAR